MGCHHCRRPVRPTMHGRHGATVDYYRTVTGPGRIESYEDARGGRQIRLLRVERVHSIVTCRDCWQEVAVQAALKAARASGELVRP